MKKRWFFLLLLVLLVACKQVPSDVVVVEVNESVNTTVTAEEETSGEITTCESNETCGSGRTCYLGFCISESDVATYIAEPEEEETTSHASETWNGTLQGVEYPYEGKTECGEVRNHYTLLLTVGSSLTNALQNETKSARILADDTEGSVSGWSLVSQSSATLYCDIEGSVLSGVSINVDASLTKSQPLIRLLTRDNGSATFETSTWTRYNASATLENGSTQILSEGSNTYNGFILVPKIISNTTISGSWRTATDEANPWEPQGTFTLMKQEGS